MAWTAVTKEHVLKCWPAQFDAVASGEKLFEVRRDDRGFQRGDILVLHRTKESDNLKVDFDWNGNALREVRRRITWILTGGQFGIEAGYVVMALAELPAPPVSEGER